jgi:transcriptional regulator GlxA family with amidase domain
VAESVEKLALLPWTGCRILKLVSSQTKPLTKAKQVKRVAFLVMPGSHALELAGPFDAFATAARDAARQNLTTSYELEVLSLAAGPVEAFGGLQLHADRAYLGLRVTDARSRIDTLVVVAGGSAATEPIPADLVNWVRLAALHVRRVASVCTGAFVLAEAGLLDGRRVTTHWAFGEALARRFPNIEVDWDNIFTRDGPIYTSAGVTAGIDLALALIEEDLGRELAMSVARSLVVYLRRPGTQSQFSTHLKLQAAERQPLRELQAWMQDHLEEDLSVETLAERAGMSPRNFARVFKQETKLTPAKYVEKIRLEAARRRLEEATATIEQVAAETGFGTLESLRRSFQRNLNVSPGAYRDRFRSALIQ